MSDDITKLIAAVEIPDEVIEAADAAYEAAHKEASKPLQGGMLPPPMSVFRIASRAAAKPVAAWAREQALLEAGGVIDQIPHTSTCSIEMPRAECTCLRGRTRQAFAALRGKEGEANAPH